MVTKLMRRHAPPPSKHEQYLENITPLTNPAYGPAVV